MAKKCFNLLLAPIALGLNFEVDASDNLSSKSNENENPKVNATNLPIVNEQPQSQQSASTQSINEAFGSYTGQQTEKVSQTGYVLNTSDTELVNKMFANQEQSHDTIPVEQATNQQNSSEIVNNMSVHNLQTSHHIPTQQETVEIHNNNAETQMYHNDVQNNANITDKNGYIIQNSMSQSDNENYIKKTAEETNKQNYQNQIVNNIPVSNFQGIGNSGNAKIENEQFTLQPQNHEIAKEKASDFIVKQAQDKITISDSSPNSLQNEIKEINEKVKIINEDIANIKENIEILTVAFSESKTSSVPQDFSESNKPSISQESQGNISDESGAESIDTQKNADSASDTEPKLEEKNNALTTEDENTQNQQEVQEDNDQEEIDEKTSNKNDTPSQEKANDDLSLILKEIKKVKDKVDNLDDKVDNLSQNGDANILESSQQKEDYDELKKKINNTTLHDDQSQNVSTSHTLSINQENDLESNASVIDENEQNIAKKK